MSQFPVDFADPDELNRQYRIAASVPQEVFAATLERYRALSVEAARDLPATLDIAYDRESAMWSRDAFEDLLKALAAAPSGGRIFIVAHSMGTLLTLETLRMLRAEAG